MCRAVVNRFKDIDWLVADRKTEQTSYISFHQTLPGYKPTPLHRLPGMASMFGLGDLWVKDESLRFNLNAFKGLGASAAIHTYLESHSPGEGITFCTATDGNHGRAVAWAARIFKQRAVIFMPVSTVPARIKNIEAEGAEVIIVDGDYDAAVRMADNEAQENGWQIIADTAYPGYDIIPAIVTSGYLTMFEEIANQSNIHAAGKPGIDVVFLQGGVGSFAAAAAMYYAFRYRENRPKLVSVEPTGAACLLESANSRNGDIVTSEGDGHTIMAGLNCPTPSTIAWPILRSNIDLFLAISDRYAQDAIKAYYRPTGTDERIISGESGAAGLAGLIALRREESLQEAREAISLSKTSRVLLINTEGDTDPENFRRIIYDE